MKHVSCLKSEELGANYPTKQDMSVSSLASPFLLHDCSKISSSFNIQNFSMNVISAKSVTSGTLRLPHKYKSSRRPLPRLKSFSPPIMEWQDCSVKMVVDVPASVAYNAYLDRESFPRWMPFISSVKVLQEKPEMSKWFLKYKAFGQDIELSWLCKNLQPIPNQKIHWRSLDGLPNRGAVRFFPKGPSSCLIELTISYEVPPFLAPFAALLRPLLESLLVRSLEGFSTFARSY